MVFFPMNTIRESNTRGLKFKVRGERLRGKIERGRILRGPER